MERDPRTYAVIGAALKVHWTLGPGFLEGVYHDALAIEFGKRGIPFRREHPVPVVYDGKVLGHPYRADFLCWNDVLVELKATVSVGNLEVAQLGHYLTATGIRVGLLLNFGAPFLQRVRVVGRKGGRGWQEASRRGEMAAD